MATFTPDTSNVIFSLAANMVNQSNRDIFLTGKAGTGKTTFLKYIRENCHKQLAVVAPTGVAAINAGGVTIHSFFQLPISPFIPEQRGFSKNNNETTDRHQLLRTMRMNNEKKKVLRQLELLIIDEISMVRCDTLDAIDTVLRHVRRNPYQRFGGIQVVFIGDMFQLPPVVPEREWNILSEFYRSPYFFDSLVMLEQPPVYIEFTKIYRQQDERFINLLNQVRNNELEEDGYELLKERLQPGFNPPREEGYVILATKNNKVDAINNAELNKLEGRTYNYTADIKGDFSEKAFPADDILKIKIGAQVMFIKNDLDKAKRYFNGKIGTVTEADDDSIFVQCKDETDTIEVKRDTWENIRYTLNKSTRQLEEEPLGSFNQFPLRLAWAITIHKSQGLTFEKVIIDAGDAFEKGQVYVALSRCTTLEGLKLHTMIRSSGLQNDSRIIDFSNSASSERSLQHKLDEAKQQYKLTVLLDLFDFKSVLGDIKELNAYFDEHNSSFNPEAKPWSEELKEKLAGVQVVSEKFQLQLKQFYQQYSGDELDEKIQERVNAAIEKYFMEHLDAAIKNILQTPVVTDSRIHTKEVNDLLKEIFAVLSIKKYLLEGFTDSLDIEAYSKRKMKFLLPAFSVNVYAGSSSSYKPTESSPHPLLHQQLRKMRDTICSQKDLPIYIVAGTATLDEMAKYLPQTLTELRKISGFGDAKVEQYGQQFLDVIINYCTPKNLSSLIHEKIPKRERKTTKDPKSTKPDTKKESLKLYKEGMTAAEISKERNLTIQTIEGHLAHFVENGEIKIDELLSREKLLLIEPVLNELGNVPLNTVRERLGNAVSFGEIKLTMAWQAFKNNTAAVDE